LNAALAAALGAVAGLGAGILTHRLNQAMVTREPEADGRPLPREEVWAPVLDGVLVALAFYRFGAGLRGLYIAAIIVLLVQVLVFDLRHRLILNRFMYPAGLLAIALAPVSPLLTGSVVGRLFTAVVGAIVLGVVATVVVVASRGGVGLGDAKLICVLGAVLGLLPAARAVFFGVLLGGVVALVLVVTRVRGMKDYIPYGPFLCAGGLVGVLFPCGFFGPTSCS
jgi:leader peptidase (prepilin peptidase)/N-methyltransferase